MNRALARRIADVLNMYDQGFHAPLRGAVVVLPHEVAPMDHDGPCPERDTYPGVQGGHAGLCHLKADLVEMLECDAVVVGGNYWHSRGCGVEIDTALAVGIPVFYFFESRRVRGLDPFLPMGRDGEA